MNELKHFFINVDARNKLLSEDLKRLQEDLMSSFENNILEAGVITPGYFSYFIPILEGYKSAKIISKYHISEEQYHNGTTGLLIKIPIVDVFSNENSYRIFVIPKTILEKLWK